MIRHDRRHVRPLPVDALGSRQALPLTSDDFGRVFPVQRKGSARHSVRSYRKMQGRYLPLIGWGLQIAPRLTLVPPATPWPLSGPPYQTPR
jgi:hypothetical protein